MANEETPTARKWEAGVWYASGGAVFCLEECGKGLHNKYYMQIQCQSKEPMTGPARAMREKLMAEDLAAQLNAVGFKKE